VRHGSKSTRVEARFTSTRNSRHTPPHEVEKPLCYTLFSTENTMTDTTLNQSVWDIPGPDGGPSLAQLDQSIAELSAPCSPVGWAGGQQNRRRKSPSAAAHRGV
jgi:hypothetical protein